MFQVAQQLRLGWRTVRAHPGFTTIVAVTLALGIGANTAALSILDSVLLTPLPYRNADQLVLVWHRSTEAPEGRGPLSSPDLMDYRDQSRTLADLAAVNSFSAALTGDGDPEQVQLGVISANFFSVLGVRPALGRDFGPADDTPMDTRDPRNTSVIILSHGLWLRRFGGAADVIGRTVLAGGTPMTVVGVLPEGFELHLPADAGMSTDLAAWTPLRIPYQTAPREGAYLKALGRLRPGVDAEAAQAELATIASGLRRRFPHHEQAGLRVAVRPLTEEVTAHIRPTLLAVTVAAAFVLLVACANVANLLLARLATRRKEMTIRAALGGSARQLGSQLLVETAILATLGTIGGLGLGWAAVKLVAWLQPATLPRIETVQVDGRFIAIGIGLAIATLLCFGLAPSVLAARPRLAEALGGREAGERRGWRRLASGLVVLQAASALVLLAATGLMLRSVANVVNAGLGYEPGAVTTFRIALPFTAYRTPARWIDVFSRLEGRLAAVPGVEAVGAIDGLPAVGGAGLEAYQVEPSVAGSPSSTGQAVYRTVTPSYFETMRVALRAGRLPTADDGPTAPFIAVVDEALADREWGNGSPIGQRILVSVARFERGYSIEQSWARVVGVVANVAHGRADAKAPGTIYLTHAQAPVWNMGLAVRSATPAGTLIPSVRSAVADIDPHLPLYQVREMKTAVAATTSQVRAVFVAALVFAGIAVTLAVVGLYGVVAVTVRRRRRELGIRLALGAGRRRILAGVLREGLLLGLAGVSVGLVIAALVTRFLGELLVNVTPFDPATMVGASLSLAALAAVASYLPAREAAEIDPVETLSDG